MSGLVPDWPTEPGRHQNITMAPLVNAAIARFAGMLAQALIKRWPTSANHGRGAE